MSIMIKDRKVQGAQWYITLPAEWRDAGGHDIKKGDTLKAHFEPDSVMVLNPDTRELSDLEDKLIKVLLNFPRLVDTRELIEDLREIVAGLDA